MVMSDQPATAAASETAQCAYAAPRKLFLATGQSHCPGKANYVVVLGGVRMRVCKRHYRKVLDEMGNKLAIGDVAFLYDPLPGPSPKEDGKGSR